LTTLNSSLFLLYFKRWNLSSVSGMFSLPIALHTFCTVRSPRGVGYLDEFLLVMLGKIVFELGGFAGKNC
jgi:hypothetical protein